MSAVWMQWHGGASYAPPDITNPRDTEQFDSLRAARDSFERRAWSSETFYPCVSDESPDDGGPVAYVYFSDPHDESLGGEPYPDRMMTFGPRGGVRVEPC